MCPSLEYEFDSPFSGVNKVLTFRGSASVESGGNPKLQFELKKRRKYQERILWIYQMSPSLYQLIRFATIYSYCLGMIQRTTKLITSKSHDSFTLDL